MDRISRRRFLEDSVALLAMAAAPVGALAAPRSGRRVGQNEIIRVAVIGLKSRGMSHVEAYANMRDVQIVALCDADTAFFGQALRAIEKAGKPVPKTYQDVRQVMDDKTIDAVSIATPNHWHALGAIWALQAGKDVYVEKPVSHNVSEGRRIVQSARKQGKICQTGTQSRASRGLQEAMAFLHGGGIGKIYLSRGLCYKRRPSIGKVEVAQTPPPTVDYNLWLGPAPEKPVMRKQFHYDWHWQWDYGNGDLGNQGIHEMDKARWGLGKTGFPNKVFALGGRFGYVDDGQTPNTIVSFFDYGDSQLIFEVRGLETPKLEAVKGGIGAGVGNIFYGDKGIMVMPSYDSATAYDLDGNKVRDFKGDGDHFRNFVDACRSRKVTDLFADIEEGHVSSALCHLGNVSYLLGTEQPFNGKTKSFGGDRDAYETIGRMEEHLAANGVKLEETKYRVGKQLKINPKTESFRDREANALLTREYRKGFEVPSKV